MMPYSRRSRYSSRSPSPYHGSRHSRSFSRSPSRSRSWSRSRDFADAANPGNNLYVTGLSSRITKGEIEELFASEGKVVDIHLVVDPYTRESRGFGFVTMSCTEEANRCIKYLDGSVLEGRVITVEKMRFIIKKLLLRIEIMLFPECFASRVDVGSRSSSNLKRFTTLTIQSKPIIKQRAKRRRGRTPTPGRYLGLQTASGRCPSTTSYSPDYKSRCSSSDRERSFSPYYYSRRCRSNSRSRSPYNRRHSQSPFRRCRYRSRDSRSRSPLLPYHSRRHYYRSVSRSPSPRMRRSRRSCSRSISPTFRKGSRRRYLRSISPRGGRSTRNISPRRRRRRRSYSMSPSSPKKRRYSRESCSHSRRRSSGSHSRSVSSSSVSSG